MTRNCSLHPKSNSGKPLVGANRKRVQGGGYIRGVGIEHEVINNNPDDPQKGPTYQNENRRNKNLDLFERTMPEYRCSVLDES
jgi:hypothetical protein